MFDICFIDSVLEFCRLADANHRYHTVSKLDATRVQKLVAAEKALEQSTSTAISVLEKRLRNVNTASLNSSTSPVDTDRDDTTVLQGISLIEKELSVSHDALRAAELAEEQARVAYEAACQVRKKAASRVTGLADTVSSVRTHQKIISEVTEKRLDLAKYSNNVASEGVELLLEFQAYMDSVHAEVGSPCVSGEVPAIFAHIISSFTAYLSEGMEGGTEREEKKRLEQFNVVMGKQSKPYFSHFDSSTEDEGGSDQTLRCLAQVGLEMTRLWRQLNPEDSYTDEVWATITKFEQEIQTKFLKQSTGGCQFPLRDNVLRGERFRSDTQHIPRYQDATVVLHYDHLQHLTPKWHFENIHRYCITDCCQASHFMPILT